MDNYNKKTINILFVCLGNICRSPMAEFIMKDMVEKRRQADRFYIASAATSREEIGNPVHPGSRRKLAEAGISCAGKYARHMEKQDYTEFDYLIGMDRANIRNMTRIAGGDPDRKIYKMMEFSESGWKQAAAGIRNPEQARDVADPWYTGNFDETWNDVVEGCAGFLEFLKARGEV